MLASPGTWWRTHVPAEPVHALSLAGVAPAGNDAPAGWEVSGLWHLDSTALQFGGFSALLLEGDAHLRAWSDRGWVLDLAAPGSYPTFESTLAPQPVEAGHGQQLWDIESVTRDADSGALWLGIEFSGAIQRFDAAGAPNGLRMIGEELDLPLNSGAEAMLRLPGGRFLLFPERSGDVVIYSADPVEGAQFTRVPISWPRPDYSVTDAALLPGGRVLVLMRDLAWSAPPFSSVLVAGEVAALDSGKPWSPSIALELDNVLPRENFEGLTVRASGDGRADIWLISDDNFSAFQRTLLAHLVWHGPTQKAREAEPRAPLQTD